MKVFIFNSGTGKRMLDLTKDKPKALVALASKETLLERQVRMLRHAGISRFVISTGPFEEQIKMLENKYPDLSFEWISNPLYDQSNSIYSLYLSAGALSDDCIVLHGDLVFSRGLIDKLLKDTRPDLCVINQQETLPEKDFKGKIKDGYLQKIAVDLFDQDCFALQPLYKLSRKTMQVWLEAVKEMVEKKEVDVYAENALNKLLPKLKVGFIDYQEDYISEVDNPEDLKRVSSESAFVDYRDQVVIETSNYIDIIKKVSKQYIMRQPFYVCSEHLLSDKKFASYVSQNRVTVFSEFSANPKYEEVVAGLELFHRDNCDGIIAIGGGSSIDMGKVIKLFSKMDPSTHFLKQDFNFIDLPLIAIPTTAGTGSESTRFAVIYDQDEKQSITQDCLLPDVAILNADFLTTLPLYIKKASLLDALSQAVESLWSIYSTPQSMEYAKEAINLIRSQDTAYFKQNLDASRKIMLASNLAGKAINLTQTTAPHAMSYKITSLTNIAHGHAVSLCLPPVMAYMVDHLDDKVVDPRGKEQVVKAFDLLTELFQVDNHKQLVEEITKFYAAFELETPKITEEQLQILVQSVNSDRLKNHPILLDEKTIEALYRSIFKMQ